MWLSTVQIRTRNEAREITERWLTEYNNERPHESLNNLTPEGYRRVTEKPEIFKRLCLHKVAKAAFFVSEYII